MVKGCQKKILHITDTGSPYFAEAYLILRGSGEFPEAEDADEMDMVKEAMKIAAGGGDAIAPRREKQRRRARWAFFLGASVCSFAFGVVMLLCYVFGGA